MKISDTFGLWDRRLLAWPDGRQDTSTVVSWLQGPSLFADLRQPQHPPPFEGVRCLKHLAREDFSWLVRQEGFAGRFVRAGSAFEWQRLIDYQCPSLAADAGCLRFSGGILVEEGRDSPYIEHWYRDAEDTAPHYAARLCDKHACQGFLIRSGPNFMYARDRANPLPQGGSLAAIVDACSIKDAHKVLDCEISIGRAVGETWTILRSSLPYRVGANLSPQFANNNSQIATSDIDHDGAHVVRQWSVAEFETTPGQRDVHSAHGSRL